MFSQLAKSMSATEGKKFSAIHFSENSKQFLELYGKLYKFSFWPIICIQPGFNCCNTLFYVYL